MVRESLKRRTYLGFLSAQMLEAKLLREQVPHHIWTDRQHNMTALLCLNPDGVRLFQRLNCVLFMDCTYRTNQYNLPLLHILGVSGSNHGFSIGMALLTQETIPFYQNVLARFKSLIGDTWPVAIVTDRCVGTFINNTSTKAVH